MCGGGVRSIFSRDNRCMYMEHDCLYACCSDCVGAWGNVYCVAAVFKDSGF